MKNALIILSAALLGLSLAYSDYKEVIPHSGLDISSNYTTSLTIGRQKYIDIGNIADCLNLIEISGQVPSFCEIVPGAIHNDTYFQTKEVLGSLQKSQYVFQNTLYEFEGKQIRSYRTNYTTLAFEKYSEATISEGKFNQAIVVDDSLIVFTSKQIQYFDRASLNLTDKCPLSNSVTKLLSWNDEIVIGCSEQSLILLKTKQQNITLIQFNNTLTHLALDGDVLIISVQNEGLLYQSMKTISPNSTFNHLRLPKLGSHILELKAKEYVLMVLQKEGFELPFYIEYYRVANNSYEAVKTSYFKERLTDWKSYNLVLIKEFAIVTINHQLIVYPLGAKESQLTESRFWLSESLLFIDAYQTLSNQFMLFLLTDTALQIQKNFNSLPSLNCRAQMNEEEKDLKIEAGAQVVTQLKLIERSCPKRETNDPKVVCGRTLTLYLDLEEQIKERGEETWVIVLGVIIVLIMVGVMIYAVIVKRRRMRQRYENLEVELGRIQDRV